MPADHLTTPAPGRLTEAVLAVLAGADLPSTAAACGLETAALTDAVHLYQAAGRAALDQLHEHDWYEVRVEFPDWKTAETAAASCLGPRLDQLQADGAVGGWWFLRKHPCWRVRLHGADTTTVDQALNDLAGTGAIVRWLPAVYESENLAFGGAAGMQAVHDLFCADSRGVLGYVRHPSPGLGRRELSILLISGLLTAAGLDSFERGDVFDRVARLRPSPAPADSARIEQLAGDVRTLLSIPDLQGSTLFTPDGPVAHAAPWLADFVTGGRRIGEAAGSGRLERGLRAALAHIVIFHWNRVGLSATAQSILARTATTVLLPGN